MRLFHALLIAAMLAATAFSEAIDIAPFLGEEWYGLYLNGEKTGYAVNRIAQKPDSSIAVIEEAQFKMTMSGIRQDMSIYSERVYTPQGDLVSIHSKVIDMSGETTFDARVDGEELIVQSVVGGHATQDRLPRPKETLADAIKHALWIRSGNRAIGDTMTFSLFEPMYQHEVGGKSTITALEEKVLDGVTTKVYTITSTLDMLNVETRTYVTEQGKVLEDVIAGIIRMRLEPEAQAKDVSYKNDVIISNAAMIDRPIANPRSRRSLHLKLFGPLGPDHLFSDERQTITPDGDAFDFKSTLPVLDDFPPARLPIAEATVQEWLKPTLYVQSDAPALIAKAKEIVGDETDARKISDTLCAWVHQNMRSTFSARMTNAVEVLEHMEGDCTEHSTLFIGLARAAGLPAREVAGLIYVEGVRPGFYFHQWAKVWIGKWIDVDPTFNQPIADVTHIKLAEGDLLQQARLIPIIGTIKIVVMEDAQKAAEP